MVDDQTTKPKQPVSTDLSLVKPFNNPKSAKTIEYLIFALPCVMFIFVMAEVIFWTKMNFDAVSDDAGFLLGGFAVLVSCQNS